MSSSQLWSPQAQRPAQNAAASLNTVRSNMIPGTWLQLSPTTSPAVGGNNFLSLSPIGSTLPSPALKATEGEEFAISGKFLTNNNGQVSRASSFSSTSSNAPRHPPLGQRMGGASIERRELAAGRAGGITSAFLSNH